MHQRSSITRLWKWAIAGAGAGAAVSREIDDVVAAITVIIICAVAGVLLGALHAAIHKESIYETVDVPFTESQLDAFEKEPAGRSLAEILADLPK